MELVIIAVSAVVVLLVLVGGIIAIRRDRQKALESRLDQYTSEYGDSLDEVLSGSESSFLAPREAVRDMADKAIEKREFAKTWKNQLGRANLKITPGEFLAAHFVSVGLFFLGAYIISGANVIFAIIAGVFGFFFPRFYVSFRLNKRLKTFENQLPDILQMWVNGLRSGYSVLQAIDAIGTEAPEPSATEFRRVVKEVQLGIGMEEALLHLLDRMPSEDLDLVITAVNIQHQVGGNLAEILDVISHTIRERIKLKGEISVLTAQGRITGYVIGGLPIALLMLLMVINPDYVGQLFTNRLCGWPMLGCGALMMSMGFMAINKIIDIEI